MNQIKWLEVVLIVINIVPLTQKRQEFKIKQRQKSKTYSNICRIQSLQNLLQGNLPKTNIQKRPPPLFPPYP